MQVYTGFIYGGPAFVRKVNDGLAALLARDGFASVQDAVGVDLKVGAAARRPPGVSGTP